MNVENDTNKALKIPAIFSWSGGKDSAYALHLVLQEGIYDVRYLLSTFNGNYKRLSMHGIREELIDAQAVSIGIPMLKVYVFESNNEEYEKQMVVALQKAADERIQHIIFGDIFLEDLRQYREERMRQASMKCVFPLWKRDTETLVHSFIENGFKTIVCCTNDAYLNEAWVGRIINTEFIKQLPSSVDPCGENGEFHSYCFDGPIFKNPIQFVVGEKLYKPLEISATDKPIQTQGFWYIDLIPSADEYSKSVKACPRCQQIFECVVDNIIECQCSNIQIPDSIRQNIAAAYDGCLCRNCLQVLSKVQ